MSALPWLIAGAVLLALVIAYGIWSEEPPPCRACREGGYKDECGMGPHR